MSPDGNAGSDDLQKAIDEITNANKPAAGAPATPAPATGAGGMSVVQPLGADADSKPEEGQPEAEKTEPSAAPTEMPAPTPEATVGATEAAPEIATTAAPEVGQIPVTGLESVKKSALADLKPILDRVELPAEDKFKVYKEMLGEEADGATIESAYNVAKQIADEKERAEGLLFIIQKIDELK